MIEINNGNKKIYYGYVITVAAWLLYFFTTGAASYGASIVSTRIVLNQGWDQSIIGLSSSILYLAVALIAVPVSVIEKRKGCRITIIFGTIIGMIAYTGLIFFSENTTIYVAMFFLMGICSSACGMTTGPALITSWHRERRASNMSIFYTSGAIAGFLMPLLARTLSDISVQLCWIVFLVETILAFLLAIFIVADKPEDKGQVMDGKMVVKDSKDPDQSAGDAELILFKKYIPSLTECYRSACFYSLFLQTFVCRMAHTGIVSYIAIYAVEKGVPFTAAAVLVTMYSTSNFIGRCLISVSSRLPFSRKAINLLGFIFMTVGSAVLPFADYYSLIVVCVLLVGVGAGLSFTIFPLLVADCFGDDNFMVLNGTYSTLGTSGSVAAPIILLAVANYAGDYGTAYLLIALLTVIATFLAVVTPIRMLNKGKHIYSDNNARVGIK